MPHLLCDIGSRFLRSQKRILRIYFTRIHFLVVGYELGLYSINQVIRRFRDRRSFVMEVIF